MTIRVPIGIDDFRKLREQECHYVDKSDLIIELIDRAGIEVVLLPRPRRFGKSLNLSMLRCFFEKHDEDLSHLFADLAVFRAGDVYRQHFQRYPVIYMSFKDIKVERFEDAWDKIRQRIRFLFDAHRYLLDSERLSDVEKEDFRRIRDGSAPVTLYHDALLLLSRCLHSHHGERAVILIDEYDEPIHAGHVHGYSQEILSFYRNFLGAGLKGNPHLFKAVLTGILRVARESIFSGLNNLAVYSLLRMPFSTCFGFTEAEVRDLLDRAGQSEHLDTVRRWYNGYLFGGHVIYNPWSVLSFIADGEGEARPHWVSTSSNDLIKHLLVHHAGALQPVFESLLAGGGIEGIIDENVVLGQLEQRTDALWSLLVFSGYLKAEKRSQGEGEQPAHFLTIPNREVRLVYKNTFREWIETHLSGRGGSVDTLTRALLSGDVENLQLQLEALIANLLSYHDTGVDSPEYVYHGFILGLLAVLEPAYKVRSNRESGRGRPDMMILPTRPGQPGVVMELKVARPHRKVGRKTMEQALDEGFARMQAKDYAAEVRASGAAPIHAFVVAFDGKEVRVSAPERPPA